MSMSSVATMATSTLHVSSPWLYNSLSFAAPEEVENAYVQSMLSPSEYRQFVNSTDDFSYIPQRPIRTLQDALTSKKACIVTTLTKPHTIVSVNDAWTKLCGYSQSEVCHQSISSILHGPLTNDAIVESTMQRVLDNIVNDDSSDDKDKTEDMYVVNYKKDHSSFINHVTIKKILLSNDQLTSGSPTYLLCGIIQPVQHVPLRMAL